MNENSLKCLICLQDFDTLHEISKAPCGFEKCFFHQACLRKTQEYQFSENWKRGEIFGMRFRCPHCNIEVQELVPGKESFLYSMRNKVWKTQIVCVIDRIKSRLKEILQKHELDECWFETSGFFEMEEGSHKDIFSTNSEKFISKRIIHSVVSLLHKTIRPVGGIRVVPNFKGDATSKVIMCRSRECDKKGFQSTYEWTIELVRMGYYHHIHKTILNSGYDFKIVKRRVRAANSLLY